jgi:hypothetical protein
MNVEVEAAMNNNELEKKSEKRGRKKDRRRDDQRSKLPATSNGAC